MGRIASTEELTKYIGVRDPSKVDGELLGVILAGAEQFVMTFTGRQFYAEPALVGGADTAPPVTKTITVRRSQRYVRIPDLRVATSVTLDNAAIGAGTGYDIADTFTEPATRIKLLNYSPYTAGWAPNPWSPYSYSTVQITGRWGFITTTSNGTLGPPDDVKDAVLTLAARRWRERDAAWSDAVQSQEGAVFQYFRTMPESVRQVLLMYRPFNFALVSESTSPPAQVTMRYQRGYSS